MKSQIENACTCCKHCEWRRFCVNGTISMEVVLIEVVEIETLMARITVRVGPEELFLCELHIDDAQVENVWVIFPDKAAALTSELRMTLAKAVIACCPEIEIETGGDN